MKLKSFLIIWGTLLLLVFSPYLSAQQKILMRPMKYNEPHRDIDISQVDRDQLSDEPWFVVAASENARTTNSPGGTSLNKTLRFGQVYWVTGEHGDYLRIAKDDRRRDDQLSNQAVDYGWVHKRDLLLWRRSLVNPETKINLKGMILNTLRALSSREADFHRIKAHKDPELKIPGEYEAKLYEILFIYQYSPSRNAVLLGRTSFFSYRQQRVDDISGNLVGWVDLDRVLEWDHRVAIEPNWRPSAFDERISRDIRASVFSPSAGNNPERCAKGFSQGQQLVNCDIAWDNDLFDEHGNAERKNGYWRRFPVMDDQRGDIYKVMAMGELTGSLGSISEGVDMEVRRKLNELINSIRNVNVVFAIDGTNSMGPFYESAINSVQRIVRWFQQADEDHKNLRFGYVVYRDYLERDRLIETGQLTTNADRIISDLRRVEATDLYDIYTHEAVYYGLKTAFDRVFTNPDETNILIHIGDAGNHYRDDPSQVDQSEIIRLIAEYKCYYIAFQAHHMSEHQAYRDFSRQIREIMSEASLRLYDEWIEVLGEGVITERPVLRQIDRNISRIENGPPMVMVSRERGQQMNIRELEDEITRAIEEIDIYTDMVVERARQILERGGGLEVLEGESEGLYASSFAPGVYNLLVRMGLDEEVIKNYYQENVQLVVEGYAPRFHPSLDNPLFEPVLLLEALEFHQIVGRLRRLRQATQASDTRDELYNTWIQLLKGHIGGMPDSYYDEVSLAHATSMVFGVPMRSGLLEQIALRDIHDPSVFSDSALSRYVRQVDFKYRALERIVNTPNYPYAFRTNDILFYWIEVDLLP